MKLAHPPLLALLTMAMPTAAQPLPASNFGPVPVPAANPQSAAKIALGKALFWDEQLSVTGTVACGTCHRPEAGGSDPRSLADDPASRHPGPDGLFGSSDDIVGSMGMPKHDADGKRLWSPSFGFSAQVTPRSARTVLNSAFESAVLWDGIESGEFRDPVTGSTIIADGAALEAQALRPLVNPVEMGAAATDAAAVAERIRNLTPLALADNLPPELPTWIAGRTYEALFEEIFGGGVTPTRMAMALASYERSLVADQTPFDAHAAGHLPFTQQQSDGLAEFNFFLCQNCHELVPRAEAADFKYTGVRPAGEDVGRLAATNDPDDTGRMQTPSIRNVSLRSTFFHNGRASTLGDVLDFYARGGDFNAANKDPRITPLQFFSSEG